MANLNKLIVIGGNSNLVQRILEVNRLKYKEIFIISHRKYYGAKKLNFSIFEDIKPLDFKKIITKIFNNNSNNLIDILVSNTPSVGSNYGLIKTREWSLISINLMNYLNDFTNLHKIIFTFSSLALIPFINKSFYKNIKKIEMTYYLNFLNSEKIIICILPPLGKINGIGNFFSEPINLWAKKIIKAFNNSNNILYPTGINGIIIKFLFYVWRKL